MVLTFGTSGGPLNANNLHINMSAILGYRCAHAKNYFSFLFPSFHDIQSKCPTNAVKNIKQKRYLSYTIKSFTASAGRRGLQ
jgi:hypothetical protein